MIEPEKPNPPWDQAITAPELLAQPDDELSVQQADDIGTYHEASDLVSIAESQLERADKHLDRDVTPTENLLLAVAILLLSQHRRAAGLDGDGRPLIQD
jgi:hypothetical protein